MHILLKSFAVLLFVTGTFVHSMELNLGIKGGINLGTMYGEYVDDLSDGMDKKLQPGLIAGLGLQIKPVDLFCISPEVLYSGKGVNMEMSGEGITANMRILSSYLELPVNFAFVIPAGNVVMPKLYAGPVFGFNLTSEIEYEIDGDSETEDTKDDISVFEFSLDFGGGCDFDLGPGLLLVDIRYTLGLTTLDNDSSDPADVKNGTLSFMAGWAFKLVK